MKFLVDECLAPSLAVRARAAGHPLSAHLVHRGMGGWSDARIMARAIEEDWTLVTRNADDFRPRPGSASARPCYLGVPLHAGLVCLNPSTGARIAEQELFFRAALSVIGPDGDLTNEVLEVWPEGDGLRVDRYAFPEA